MYDLKKICFSSSSYRKTSSLSPCLRCRTRTLLLLSWTKMLSRENQNPDTSGPCHRTACRSDSLSCVVLFKLDLGSEFQSSSQGVCRGRVRLWHRGGKLASAGRCCQQLNHITCRSSCLKSFDSHEPFGY